MKIGIISDTHGSLMAFQKTLGIFEQCDYILHAGDILYHGPRNPLPEGYNPRELANAINDLKIPFMAAAGNCDAPIDQALIDIPIQSPYAIFCTEHFRILINHGDKINEENLIKLATRWKLNLVVSGHTHIKRLVKKDGVILLNPGSCALPKDDIPSVALISDSKISLIDIRNRTDIMALDL